MRINGNIPGTRKLLRTIGIPSKTQSRNAAKVLFQKPTRCNNTGAAVEAAVVIGSVGLLGGTEAVETAAAATGIAGIPVGVGSEGCVFNVEAVATIIAPRPSSVATHQINMPRMGTM